DDALQVPLTDGSRRSVLALAGSDSFAWASFGLVLYPNHMPQFESRCQPEIAYGLDCFRPFFLLPLETHPHPLVVDPSRMDYKHTDRLVNSAVPHSSDPQKTAGDRSPPET